jgi:ubiquitin-protein ligase
MYKLKMTFPEEYPAKPPKCASFSLYPDSAYLSC